MKNSTENPSLLRRLVSVPARAWRGFWAGAALFLLKVRNRLRRWRGLKIDYVILPVGGPLPERAPPPRTFIERRLPLPSPALSLQRLNEKLQKIIDADNVHGVLFIFQGFQAGLATLQNLRTSINRLQEAGKEVVVFTPYLDARHYYVASAADKIVTPPGTQFDVLGLYAEVMFLKEALQQIGLQVDVVQISPYKTAYDMLQHVEMTPEYREQIEGLLDEQYDMLTADMAAGRSLSQQEMKALIDRAPFSAAEAQESGLVDQVAYEDELAHLLAGPRSAPAELESEQKETAPAKRNNQIAGEAANGSAQQARAKLSTWRQSRKALTEKYYRRQRPFIGVVSLDGLIVMGPSRRSPIDIPVPFVGGAVAGEQTLLELLRKAEGLKDMAALIFHVDSGGGIALAADLIAREVERIGRKIPVVVYMGNVAASGGYYVSARAQHIMSQRATMTGSIGVISARPAAQELYEKLKIHRVSVKRGQRAGLYTNLAPLSEEERQIYWDSIVRTYEEFKQVVADGRNLPYEELDAISEGRVWSGRQAKDRLLVDSHGDFIDAVQEAATLAELPFEHISQLKVVNLHSKESGYVLPRPNETINELSQLLSRNRIETLSGRPLALVPFTLDYS